MKLMQLLSTTLVAVFAQESLTMYGRSDETDMAWRPDPDSFSVVEFNYYTTMDTEGDVWAHFKLGITNYDTPADE